MFQCCLSLYDADADAMATLLISCQAGERAKFLQQHRTKEKERIEQTCPSTLGFNYNIAWARV